MQYQLSLLVKAVDMASGVLRKVGNAGSELSGKMKGLGTAASVAGGILMADMVRGASRFMQEAIQLGGTVETLTNSFNKLTASAGVTQLTLQSLRDATQGTVADIDLLKAANQALLLNIPVEEFDQLAAAAVNLGHAMGIDARNAIESLTTGVGRQSKLILDNLGVVFQASEAYDWYAETLGKTSNQLDESEKRLGWQTYAIEQIMKKSEELGDITSETQLAQERWNAGLKNLSTSMGNFLKIFQPILPAISALMPMFGTLAGILLPKLITKTNLLAMSSKLLALSKALVSKSTYITIAGHLKEIGAMVANTAATIAHKIATWALNAALTVKIGLLTLGIGLVATTIAVTSAMAKVTEAAAEAEGDLSTSLVSSTSASKKNAEQMQHLNDVVDESGHSWYTTARFIDSKIVDLKEKHRLLAIEVTSDMEAIALSYEDAWQRGRFREAATIITTFAELHNLTFENAEAIITKYTKKVIGMVILVSKAAEVLADEWNITAAKSSMALRVITKEFSDAFEAKRFTDAAQVIGDFAEATGISFEAAEHIIRDYAAAMKEVLSEHEQILATIKAAESSFLSNQEQVAQSEKAFTDALETEWHTINAAADIYLPGFAEAFEDAFSAKRWTSASAAISAFAGKHQISFETARIIIDEYLTSLNQVGVAVNAVLGPISILARELEDQSNIMDASASDVLPDISAQFKDAFESGRFEDAAQTVSDFADSFSIDINRAHDVITGFLVDLENADASAFQDLVDDLQLALDLDDVDTDTFEDLVRELTGSLDLSSIDTDIFQDLVDQLSKPLESGAVAMTSLVDEINSLIQRGLIGDAQSKIAEFVECSTGKQFDMVDQIAGYLDDLVKEYDKNAAEIAWLEKTGLAKETGMLRARNEALADQMRQLKAWRGLAMAEMPAFPSAVATPTQNMPSIYGGQSAQPINFTFQGPVVQIQGSADQATAEEAARLVTENLKKVVVEATSTGTNVITSRIRLSRL